MYKGLSIGVVIPAHNEARLLPVTLAGLPDFVDRIIVVDDASSDQTAELAAQSPKTEVLRHSENQGVGAAIQTGYRRALEIGVDAVVVVGADAQMDPSEMTLLLDPLVADEADYVKGDRLSHPKVREYMPRARYFGNWALTLATRALCGYWHLRDAQCGYTAISAQMLRRLPLDDFYPRYGIPNDLLGYLADEGARVKDRTVTPIYGEEISGIHIPKVIVPISKLLCRIAVRRLKNKISKFKNR